MKRREGKKDGFALAITLIVMALISILAFSIMAIVGAQSRTVSNQAQSIKAYYLARMGIDRAMAELRCNVFWTGRGESGTESSPSVPLKVFNVNAKGFSGTYTVSVLERTSNSTSAIKYWQLTATGQTEDSTRILKSWVTTESFAKYAYFTDYDYGYWMSGNIFDGPVHTNGLFTYNGNPKYAYQVTCANLRTYDGLNNADEGWLLTLGSTNRYKYEKQWREGTFYDFNDPSKTHFYCPLNSTSSTYSTWTDGPAAYLGSTNYSFQCGQPEIRLPIDTSGIKNVADISINPSGSSTNNYYMTFYMDGSNCRYVIRSGSSTGTKVTPDPDPLLPGDSTIHVNGNLYLQNSKVKGKVTLAASNQVYIQGNLKLNSTSEDMVGLVGQKDVQVDTPGNDVTIHASILAISGSFKAKSYSFSPQKHMYLYGGNIARSAGYFATSSTGYIEHYVYDTRFLNSCPKNFPITGRMKVLSIEDNAALN